MLYLAAFWLELRLGVKEEANVALEASVPTRLDLLGSEGVAAVLLGWLLLLSEFYWLFSI